MNEDMPELQSDADSDTNSDAGSDTRSDTQTDLAEEIRQALRTVSDPELGLNIVDLGLVYDIRVEEGAAAVDMTLTSPGCPAGPQILESARAAVVGVEGVGQAKVNLVWKPFWTPDRIDPAVRALMGF
jgi:metal-sulfur cluster biosynthetic enzyme